MDVQKTILELLSAGLTQQVIADSVGYSQPHISDIASGSIKIKRPSYVLVDGLLQLKKKHILEAA